MNIKGFKEGDIITREKKHFGDGSYVGDKLIFVGYEKPIIALIREDCGRYEELIIESAIDDGWEEGWKLYPVGLIERMKKMLVSLVKNKSKNNLAA
jgi:hypothetical protein